MDLLEVMAHVRHIVPDQGTQHDRFVGGDPTQHIRRGIWNPLDHVCEMMIIRNPQVDELKP
jgi:hypothetical protein